MRNSCLVWPAGGRVVGELLLDARSSYFDAVTPLHGRPQPRAALSSSLLDPLVATAGATDAWADEDLRQLPDTLAVLMVGASDYLLGLASMYATVEQYPWTRSHIPIIRSFVEATSQVSWLCRPLFRVDHLDAPSLIRIDEEAHASRSLSALARLHLLLLDSLEAERKEVAELNTTASDQYAKAQQRIAVAQARAASLFPQTDFSGRPAQWQIINQRKPNFTDNVDALQDLVFLDKSQDGSAPNAYRFLSGESHSSLHRLYASLTRTPCGDHHHLELQPNYSRAEQIAGFVFHIWARATEIVVKGMGAHDAPLERWEDRVRSQIASADELVRQHEIRSETADNQPGLG